MTEEKTGLIDLTKNKNQAAFFRAVMNTVAGVGPRYRYFAFGGAIRGGKTFVMLFILILLAKKYPRSRWHVVRATNAVLLSNTIPSFLKLKPASVEMRYSPQMKAIFPNGSIIHFISENITQNPDLGHFLGLESNGILLEQGEELDERTWDMAKQRVGSWTMPADLMPPALVLTSFNPNDGWSRGAFYEKHKAGTLEPPYYYREALPSDNPYVTADQWAGWLEMDEVSYKMMIEGDWDARRTDNAFYFSFSRVQHVQDCPFIEGLPVHLSFDQNVLPYLSMSCWQLHRDADGVEWLRCFDAFPMRPPEATSGAAAAAFLRKYGHVAKQVFVYGDASGNKKDTRQNKTDYEIIKQALRPMLNNQSDRTWRQNPAVLRRREWENNILSGKYPKKRILIDPSCKEVAADFHNVKTDANGMKLKSVTTGPNGEKYQEWGHFSDTGDYVITKIWEDDYRRFTGNVLSIVSSVG